MAKATLEAETYSYDSQNRLVGYASPSVAATYAYDALDRRIAKTVGGGQTAYVYDMAPEAPLPFDDIVLEFDGDGVGQVLVRRWAHSDAVDEPLGFEAYVSQSGVGTGIDHAVYADRQGSVIRVVTPATGTVVASYQYDAYGRTTQVSGTLVQPYGYTGREYDAESGMYHYRARAYDPLTGAFLQVDPLEFGGGLGNLYSYVGADPVMFDDPTGLTMALQHRQVTAVGMGAVGQIGLSTLKLGATILAAIAAANALNGDVADYPGYGNASDRDPNGDKCAAAKERVRRAKQNARRCSVGDQPNNLMNFASMLELAVSRAQRDALCTDGPKGSATYGGEMEAAINAWVGVANCTTVLAITGGR